MSVRVSDNMMRAIVQKLREMPTPSRTPPSVASRRDEAGGAGCWAKITQVHDNGVYSWQRAFFDPKATPPTGAYFSGWTPVTTGDQNLQAVGGAVASVDDVVWIRPGGYDASQKFWWVLDKTPSIAWGKVVSINLNIIVITPCDAQGTVTGAVDVSIIDAGPPSGVWPGVPLEDPEVDSIVTYLYAPVVLAAVTYDGLLLYSRRLPAVYSDGMSLQINGSGELYWDWVRAHD